MTEINYFDTPEDRRRGRTGIADFMAGILRAREKNRIAESRKSCVEAIGYEHEFSDEEINGEPNN